MGMLSKQLEELKWFRDILKNGGKVPSFYESQWQIIEDAIDTIEALSAKIQAHNFNNGWIKCEDGLPQITIEGRYSEDVLTV